MGLKDALNNMGDSIKGAVDNAKDATSEAGHKSAAETEQTKRDVAGDQMTTGDKAGSMFNQAKNSIQADTAGAKQDVRNNT